MPKGSVQSQRYTDLVDRREGRIDTRLDRGTTVLDDVRSLLKNNVKLEPVTVAWENGFRLLLENPIDIFEEDFPYGWVNFYRIDDYSATSYFYLDKPSTRLGELPKVSQRL